MRDRYYGDNRDLVKWGVLLTLAERHAAKHILQVLYYRSTEWSALELDGREVPLPQAVVRHFRNSLGITTIECGLSVEVLADVFATRDEYHRAVIERVQNRSHLPGIVFLDPDTGLEPRSPSMDHVLERELADVWAALRPRDLLVFYQHQTNRKGQPWIPEKKEQFERAIGLPAGAARTGRSEKIARDVAFFYAEKPANTSLQPTAAGGIQSRRG